MTVWSWSLFYRIEHIAMCVDRDSQIELRITQSRSASNRMTFVSMTVVFLISLPGEMIQSSFAERNDTTKNLSNQCYLSKSIAVLIGTILSVSHSRQCRLGAYTCEFALATTIFLRGNLQVFVIIFPCWNSAYCMIARVLVCVKQYVDFCQVSKGISRYGFDSCIDLRSRRMLEYGVYF